MLNRYNLENSWFGQAGGQGMQRERGDGLVPDGDLSRPKSLEKLLFWGILGGLSVFFAEVVIGSSPFAFFTPWGIIVVCPLYTLHLLILASIVLAKRRPRFSALYFGGVLFGLYEAYMTKQLWNPTWSDQPVHIGGVALFETIILALWWHPLMAFLAPLLVAETALCGSRDVVRALPRRLRRALLGKHSAIVLFGLAVVLGLLHSSDHTKRPTVVHLLASGALSVGVVFLLVWLWRWRTRGRNLPLRAFLPTRREFVLLCVWLALLYLGAGALLRPEALPGLGPQASIWLLYFVFGAGLVLSLKRSRRAPTVQLDARPSAFSWRLWLALSAVFVTTSALSRSVLGLATPVFLLASLVIGVPTGMVALLCCTWGTLMRREGASGS